LQSAFFKVTESAAIRFTAGPGRTPAARRRLGPPAYGRAPGSFRNFGREAAVRGLAAATASAVSRWCGPDRGGTFGKVKPEVVDASWGFDALWLTRW
jgi:hypothetical protein